MSRFQHVIFPKCVKVQHRYQEVDFEGKLIMRAQQLCLRGQRNSLSSVINSGCKHIAHEFTWIWKKKAKWCLFFYCKNVPCVSFVYSDNIETQNIFTRCIVLVCSALEVSYIKIEYDPWLYGSVIKSWTWECKNDQRKKVCQGLYQRNHKMPQWSCIEASTEP